MKITVLIILCISIFLDIASSMTEVPQGAYRAQDTLVCEGDDFHDDVSENNTKSNLHCHCHAGHFHVGILEKNDLRRENEFQYNKPIFPFFSSGNSRNYLSKINRPPIA
jgi:hypothetical protein